MSNELAQCLAANGYRMTAPRRVVAQVLQETTTPLVPQEIHARGLLRHAQLGLVTVYRTLELFQELGVIHRVHRDDGCHGYIWVSAGHRHLLTCARCGQAVEFPGWDDLAAFIVQIEAHTGYQVEAHLLQLSGLCPDCQDVTA